MCILLASSPDAACLGQNTGLLLTPFRVLRTGPQRRRFIYHLFRFSAMAYESSGFFPYLSTIP